MSQLTCGFIGLGLIGGSIAHAIKERLDNTCIIAYDINPDALSAALADGVADIICHEIDEHFEKCDYIFLCAPVQKNDENLTKIMHHLSDNCILTDVGSVKSEIHRHIAELGLEDRFIGGHPMAGSERIGYVNSKAVLLENAYYILTSTEKTSPAKLEAYRSLITEIGAIPLILSCDQHDYVTAAISHLPHVIAASLVNLVKDSDSSDGIMRMIAAGGFKDITRIASSSAVMWQNICLTNTDNILSLLDAYMSYLEKIRSRLADREADGLYQFFEDARIYRDSFLSASSGPIKISYSVNVDIADEPGALAAIATLLALKQISIKNIGIVHNRESEDGVLRIEFYDEDDMNKAESMLTTRGYQLYRKN